MPTVLQRIGFATLSLFDLGVGAAWFFLIYSATLRIALGVPFGICWAGFRAKILHNAFHRNGPKSDGAARDSAIAHDVPATVASGENSPAFAILGTFAVYVF
jgi:hypothetical protein